MLKYKKFLIFLFVLIVIVSIFFLFMPKKQEKIPQIIKNETEDEKYAKVISNKALKTIEEAKDKDVNMNVNIYLNPREPLKILNNYTFTVKLYLVGNISNYCENYRILAYNEEHKKLKVLNCSEKRLSEMATLLNITVYGVVNKKIEVYFDKKDQTYPDIQPITVRR